MNSLKLHLPNVPSIPRNQKLMDRAAGKGLKTKNPFSYLSGSIAANQKRRQKTQRKELHG